jgi:hypothetical protein
MNFRRYLFLVDQRDKKPGVTKEERVISQEKGAKKEGRPIV